MRLSLREAKPRRLRTAKPLARKPFQTPRKAAQDSAAVAEYIADIAGQLARLAGSVRLDTLTYFLNMARMEAEAQMSRRP
jgi:hypothetical protein